MNWPFVSLIEEFTHFLLLFSCCSLSCGTPSEYRCGTFYFCQLSVAFTETEVLWGVSLSTSSCSPVPEAVLSHDFTPFHFLKVPTHFCHLSIWQRPLSSAGSPLKAEAGSYLLENPSPAHTWEAGSKGCCPVGAGEVRPGTRVQLALNWWNLWTVWLLSLKFLTFICFLWDRVNIL